MTQFCDNDWYNINHTHCFFCVCIFLDWIIFATIDCINFTTRLEHDWRAKQRGVGNAIHGWLANHLDTIATMTTRMIDIQWFYCNLCFWKMGSEVNYIFCKSTKTSNKILSQNWPLKRCLENKSHAIWIWRINLAIVKC